MRRILMALLVVILGLSIGAWAVGSERVLYTFTGGVDGGNPYAGLVFDKNGNLYGTTVYGGVYGYGAVFELHPEPNGTWSETVLHSFNLDGRDGIRPYSSLVIDAVGNLYGTTNIGGRYAQGTVFEVSPHLNGRWTERILHHFNPNGKDGYAPYAALVFDAHGNLFGTTSSGGAGQVGTVFKMTAGPKGTWQETVIYAFNYTDGGQPYGGLVLDRKGNLYGTTQYGGDFSHGTVFELKLQSNNSWSEEVLHSFDSSSGDGFDPYGGLVIDKSNRLYGMTLYGGASYAWGAVFELQQINGKWQESVIHSFSENNDGINPYGPLAIDSAGRLYGLTFQSVVNNIGGAGIVFRLSRTAGNKWQETVFHQFGNTPGDGGNPYSGVVLDGAGNIYGTTYWGGNSGGTGVVFEVTP